MAEIKRGERVRRRGRSRLQQAQHGAEKRVGILPGRIFLVRINGCKSFSNKSLREGLGLSLNEVREKQEQEDDVELTVPKGA